MAANHHDSVLTCKVASEMSSSPQRRFCIHNSASIRARLAISMKYNFSLTIPVRPFAFIHVYVHSILVRYHLASVYIPVRYLRGWSQFACSILNIYYERKALKSELLICSCLFATSMSTLHNLDFQAKMSIGHFRFGTHRPLTSWACLIYESGIGNS